MRPTALLVLATLAAALSGCTTPDACDGRDGDALFLSVEQPVTQEPPLFFIAELQPGGQEQAVPDDGCVVFTPPQGAYTAVVTYWVEGTECAHTAQRSVDWEGATLRYVIEAGDYDFHCEDA